MKKLALLCLCLTAALSAAAVNPPVGVERVRWWDPEYLTVTWGGDITPDWRDNYSRKCREYIVSLLESPSSMDQKLFYKPGDSPIYIGSRVIAVDGTDAKGWNADRFYSAIESPFKHILTLEHPGKGQYEVVLGNDLPAWMTAAGFHPRTCAWGRTQYNTLPDGYRIRIDKDVNWRAFKTYDYYFSSDDVLADKELFETICRKLEENGLKRDEEIAKKKEKGIEKMKAEWLEQLMSTGGSRREQMRRPLTKMIHDWTAWQPLHKEVRLFYGKEAWQRLKEHKAEKRLDVPTLFLRGANELKGKRNNPAEMQYLSKGQFVMIDDCGHMLNMEQSEAFNRAVLQFLQNR